MKKLLALVLCFALVAALFVGCSKPADTPNESKDPAPNEGEAKTITVGLICIGDENDQGYTYNFIRGRDAATKALEAKGINVKWITKWNIPEGDACEDANLELAEAGCQIIFNNSFGFEDYMLKVAAKEEYKDIQFVACTNKQSATDDLPNTHNAFANIYEGRYLAGFVAGMKLQQLVENETIKPEEAVIGYVGAFPYEEIKSGYTAYFLGARMVCPSVTMKVQFVNDWSNATAEGNAAAALCDMGCKLISQHADNSTPATTAQSKGAFFTSYNNDMISVAPEACLVGTRIDWSIYFCEAIEAVVNGKEIPQDWSKGIADGAVVLTPLNKDIIAPGTEEKLAEIEAGLKDGSIQVFDTDTFTVGGQKLEHAFARDTDGDFRPDTDEAVYDGAFHESVFQSAPYFGLDIDGIELLN